MARYTRTKLPRNKWGIPTGGSTNRISSSSSSSSGGGGAMTQEAVERVNQLWDWFYPHTKVTETTDENGNVVTANTVSDIHCKYSFVSDHEVTAHGHGAGDAGGSGTGGGGVTGESQNVNVIIFTNSDGDEISIGYNEVKALLELLRWFYKDSAGNVHTPFHFIGDKDVVSLGGAPMEGGASGGGSFDLSGYWTSEQVKAYIGQVIASGGAGSSSSGGGADCSCDSEAFNKVYGWYVAEGDRINNTVTKVGTWFSENNGTLTIKDNVKVEGGVSATGEVEAYKE